MLARLYEAEWDVGAVVEGLVKAKRLKDLARRWSRELREVVEGPDSLSREDFPEELKEELIASNLIVYDMYPREDRFWIDEPPPERLGARDRGDVAWQSPLHREALKKACEAVP
jgi:hypothetical protein